MLDSIATAPGGGAAAAKVVLFPGAAPPYWRANLPAIPLIRGQKRPAIGAWQRFGHRMPFGTERAAWLRQFSRGNTGLPAGPASGIVFVDIDTDDPVLRRAIESVLPPSPWTRVGAKGAIRAYRFSGEATTRIKGADGGTFVEVLSTGAQAAMPPSIHPTSLAPYVSSTNLHERRVLDALEPLPPDVEGLLRDALAGAGAVLGGGGTGKGSG